MTDLVTLPPVQTFTAPLHGMLGFACRTAREGARRLIVALGMVMVVAGFVLALFPWHPGLPLLVIGLILVLRNSPRSRRRFVVLQRRHPRIIFPVRRLIRREPEVVPVFWQQILRLERVVLPYRWRRAVSWRRKYFRARRAV